MRVVVVGGQGFLGGAIAQELVNRGDSVVVLDKAADEDACADQFGVGAVELVRGDITRPDDLYDAFRGADEVYHLAGVLGTSELEDSVLEAVEGNIVGSINVFAAALRADVPTVFFPSKPNVWLNTYTITKFAAEQFAQLYAAQHAIRIPSLRYFNAYGPRQSLSPIRKLVPAFAVQALRGSPLSIYGDGAQTVDLIYAPDLARCTVDFTRSGYAGEAVDCGRGLGVSVLDVAQWVNDFVENKGGVRHLPMRRGESPATELVASTTVLEQTIGGLEFADFDESLAETVRWYATRSDAELAQAAATLGVG